jgi:hypothetical protein
MAGRNTNTSGLRIKAAIRANSAQTTAKRRETIGLALFSIRGKITPTAPD